MSDSFRQWSVAGKWPEAAPEAAREWLERASESPLDEDVVKPDDPGHPDAPWRDPDQEGECDFSSEHDTASWCFYSEIHGNIEACARLIQEFLRRWYSPGAFVTFEWADTESKPRLDRFGGGAVYVDALEVVFKTTSGLVKELTASRGVRKTVRVAGTWFTHPRYLAGHVRGLGAQTLRVVTGVHTGSRGCVFVRRTAQGWSAHGIWGDKRASWSGATIDALDRRIVAWVKRELS